MELNLTQSEMFIAVFGFCAGVGFCLGLSEKIAGRKFFVTPVNLSFLFSILAFLFSIATR